MNSRRTSNPNMITPPLVKDQMLPTGHWYHYGLFFKVSEVEWIQGMVDSTLLPRDFGHTEHLWNNIPPYYRWTDENQLVGGGQLQQFLSVFGFELDTGPGVHRVVAARLRHGLVTDPLAAETRAELRLRVRAGHRGHPLPLAVLRARALLRDPGHERVPGGRDPEDVEVPRHVTGGSNLMLLPDDSDFYQSTGNWGGPHPTVDTPGTPVCYTNVTLTKALGVTPPEGVGRGVMSVTTPKADVGSDLEITCGCRLLHPADAYQEVTPLKGGIPVRRGCPTGSRCGSSPPSRRSPCNSR